MSESDNGLTLVHEYDGDKFYKMSFEFTQTHSIRCSKCGTIIMPQRMNSHCNCGRVFNGKHGLVVFDMSKLNPVDV